MKRVILTSVFCSAVLFANSNNYGYEVSAISSGILSDSKINLEDKNYINGGLAIAKNIESNFVDQVELSYLRSDKLNYKNSKDTTYINRGFLNFIKNIPINNNFGFYGLVGGGYQNYTNEFNTHQDTPLVNYGLGMKYSFANDIALKTDIRHLISTESLKTNEMLYSLGLSIPFMAKEKPIVAPVIEEKEPEKPKILDSDKDGVLDDRDMCPDTPEGTIVDRSGCELDDDDDGVINRLDKCPNTSPDVKANEDGCFDTVNLKINFETNSAVIRKSYDSNLKDFANLMNQNQKLGAVIEAHTDSRGTDKHNQILSEKRAASTVNALKALEVSPTRLKAVGYGETKPIAPNDSEEGRSQNRRVIGYINQ